jgi:hypothetical protein
MMPVLLLDNETLTPLDKLEIRYSTLFHQTIDARNSAWSVTRYWKAACHSAGRDVLAERKRRGLPSGPGALVLAIRKHRFPLTPIGGAR